MVIQHQNLDKVDQFLKPFAFSSPKLPIFDAALFKTLDRHDLNNLHIKKTAIIKSLLVSIQNLDLYCLPFKGSK